MQDMKNINASLHVKLNKSASLYHAIRGFINTRKDDTDTNDIFKLRFGKIYETMALTGGDNILIREKLTNNGSQASMKEKQSQIDQMKAI